jgi:hypothetical protein
MDPIKDYGISLSPSLLFLLVAAPVAKRKLEELRGDFRDFAPPLPCASVAPARP